MISEYDIENKMLCKNNCPNKTLLIILFYSQSNIFEKIIIKLRIKKNADF